MLATAWEWTAIGLDISVLEKKPVPVIDFEQPSIDWTTVSDAS